MNRLLILLFILIDVNVLFSQETLSDTYTPSGNGYIMTVPFEFKFLNCIGSDGIPHLSVGKITKNAVSNKYKYNGKIYTEEDLGSESFSNMTKYIGYTDIELVIWDGNWQLGTVRLTNVTGYNVGCQGQLYDVFKKLGINGKEYKEKINLLSIGNIRIIKISNSDAGLEMKIKDYDKNNKIKSLIDDANYSFSYMRYEDAENICNEIKKIDYSNARANEILEKIKVIRKEETKKLDYNQFILKGDNYYAKKDFTNAIQEYKSALNTGYDNEKAQSKVREAETAEEKRAAAKEDKSGNNSETKKNEGTLIIPDNSGENSNSNESENEEGSSESDSSYNSRNSLIDLYNQLVYNADVMRANGQAGTPAYNRTMNEIRQLESRLGISGSNSYSSQATINDLAYSAAQMLSLIPEADSYTSNIGLSFSLNYVNNISLVLTEGWVWGNIFLDMKFAGVVVPTKGWKYDQEINTSSRFELQNFAIDNNADPMDLFVKRGSGGDYSYYKYNKNMLGFGGGMGLAFGFVIPIEKMFAIKMGVAADGEITTLYYKFGYGYEADFCIGKWIIGLGYKTSEYYDPQPSKIGYQNKVILNDPELMFSTNYSDDLKTLDNDPPDSNQIKNHFVIRLAYAW